MIILDGRTAEDAMKVTEMAHIDSIAKQYTNILMSRIFKNAENGKDVLIARFKLGDKDDIQKNVFTNCTIKRVVEYLVAKGFNLSYTLYNSAKYSFDVFTYKQPNDEESYIEIKW